MKFDEIKVGGVYWDNYHRCLIEVKRYDRTFNVWVYDDIIPDFEGNMARNLDLYDHEASNYQLPNNLLKLLYLGK